MKYICTFFLLLSVLYAESGFSVTTPAEYDPAEALILSWDMQFSDLISDIASCAAEDYPVFITCADSSLATAFLKARNTRMQNIFFIPHKCSLWMRDYGPIIVYTENGKREIVDLNYGEEPEDSFNERFAAKTGFTLRKTDFPELGGNIIFDGSRTAFISDYIIEDEICTESEIKQYMKELFGAEKLIILKSLEGENTGHIDMYCKLVSKNTMIMGQFKNEAEGGEVNYRILQENFKKVAESENYEGERFTVIPLPMPAPVKSEKGTGFTFFSYSNSVIMNSHVFVPQYGIDEDTEAAEIYRSIFPNHQIDFFDCSGVIHYKGALHCMVQLLMKEPIQVIHEPVHNSKRFIPVKISFSIESLYPIIPAGVQIFWKDTSAKILNRTRADFADGKFTGYFVPEFQSRQVEYFIRAINEKGMWKVYPDKDTIRIKLTEK